MHTSEASWPSLASQKTQAHGPLPSSIQNSFYAGSFSTVACSVQMQPYCLFLLTSIINISYKYIIRSSICLPCFFLIPLPPLRYLIPWIGEAQDVTAGKYLPTVLTTFFWLLHSFMGCEQQIQDLAWV